MTESASGPIVEVSSAWEGSPGEAFEQWEALLSNTLVPVSLAPVHRDMFYGRATHTTFDRLGLSEFASSGLIARRSPRHVSRSGEDFVNAIFVTSGRGLVEQAGRTATATSATLALFRTDVPYTVVVENPTAMLVVQVPWGCVLDHAAMAPGRLSAVLEIPVQGATALVTQFFRGLADLQFSAPEQAAALAVHGTALLASMLSLTLGAQGSEQATRELAWQQVLSVLRARYTDPTLTIDEIADACHMSRRSLYRLCDHIDGGIAALLRQMRIDRARHLLRACPYAPISTIALSCGFTTENNFYRVFRQQTGMTPGEFRAHHCRGTDCQ